MAIELDISVGELAIERAGRIPVLETFGIDYCCNGKQSLAEACRAAGCDPEEVVAALVRSDSEAGSRAAGTDATASIDWKEQSLAALLDHIISQHHDYLRRELPRLADIAGKVLSAHGERHPDLHQVVRQYGALRAELENHLAKEEQILFPMIKEMEAARIVAAAHCGSVANPISVMEHEHERAGEALRNLRRLTDDYTPPGDACPTYHALLDGLADLERDLHQHIHLENNLVHPRALALEASLPGAPPR